MQVIYFARARKLFQYPFLFTKGFFQTYPLQGKIRRARVIAPFPKDQPGDLELIEEDIIDILGEVDDQWLQVRKKGLRAFYFWDNFFLSTMVLEHFAYSRTN